MPRTKRPVNTPCVCGTSRSSSASCRADTAVQTTRFFAPSTKPVLRRREFTVPRLKPAPSADRVPPDGIRVRTTPESDATTESERVIVPEWQESTITCTRRPASLSSSAPISSSRNQVVHLHRSDLRGNHPGVVGHQRLVVTVRFVAVRVALEISVTRKIQQRTVARVCPGLEPVADTAQNRRTGRLRVGQQPDLRRSVAEMFGQQSAHVVRVAHGAAKSRNPGAGVTVDPDQQRPVALRTSGTSAVEPAASSPVSSSGAMPVRSLSQPAKAATLV